MDQQIYRYPLTVLESHLDFMGHVNNAVYFQILEEARWEMITNNGYGVREIQETGIGPIVLDTHVRFRRELRLRQKVFIETQFVSFQKILAKLAQKITDNEGQIYCEAEFTFGLFDTKRRKLVAPTPLWSKALGAPELIRG